MYYFLPCCPSRARTQELEQQQPSVEEELRRLLEKPGNTILFLLNSFRFFFFNSSLKYSFCVSMTDDMKSAEEQQQETLLMERLMEIVNGRNAIVEGLDKDRLRWLSSRTWNQRLRTNRANTAWTTTTTESYKQQTQSIVNVKYTFNRSIHVACCFNGPKRKLQQIQKNPR